jgi:hypothetical protein
MIPEFQSDLNVVQMDGQHWKLLSPLVYESSGPLGEVIVPAGFLTDFASTPRIIWMFMPKSGEYDAAAVVHDFLYRIGGKLSGKTYTKADADNLFNEALKLLGTGQPARWVMYQSVKHFGKGNF